MLRSRHACRVRLIAALAVALVPALCGHTRTALGRAPALVPFTSTLYPYSMRYPSGWNHTTFPLGKITADVFVNPKTTEGFTDNVNVYQDPLPAPTTDAALQSESEDYLRHAFRVSPRVVGHARVSGHRIALFGYPMAFGGRTFSATQAVVVLGSDAWYFTLSVAPRDTATMRPVFTAMLGTFKLH
jgi:hypothetical protein